MTVTVTYSDFYPLKLNETDLIKSVRQNVLLILSTFRGSVPLYRDFGISSEALDKPVNVARTLLVSDIRESVEKYEPRVTVRDITFEADMSGRLIPTVEVEINEQE